MSEEAPNLSIGTIVLNPKKPEWGPGRVLDVNGTKLVVYFRDVSAATPELAVKTLDSKIVTLERAESQTDPLLDNLPPYRNGKFVRSPRPRVTLQEGIDLFRQKFPLYFEDPVYISDPKRGERSYKLEAHDLFERTLGNGHLTQLLATDRFEEVRKHALAVVGKLNLVGRFESSAFRDALRGDSPALDYFRALEKILANPKSAIDEESFRAYLDVVSNLPSEEGKSSPAKWTIATLLPFIAQPQRFMFLKPEVTQDCAARLTFDLAYETTLNWETYAKLLEMSAFLLKVLEPYGARDFIDVQSFIYVIGHDAGGRK